jgi:hypothetical protein
VIVYETDRLVVRDWTADPGDLARVFDIYSRPEVVRWLGAAPGLPMADPAHRHDPRRSAHRLVRR